MADDKGYSVGDILGFLCALGIAGAFLVPLAIILWKWALSW